MEVLSIVSLSFPAVVFLVSTYALLINKVFGVFQLVGAKMNARLRSTSRIIYVSGNGLVFGAMHVALAVWCRSDEICSETPLNRSECVVLAPSVILAFLLSTLVDRVAVPLFSIKYEWAYACTGYARIITSVAICTAWVGLAHADPMSILLLATLVARRSLAPFPVSSKVYLLGLKVFVLTKTALSLRKGCDGVQPAIAVATTTSILLL
jgi:hypothetical protein